MENSLTWHFAKNWSIFFSLVEMVLLSNPDYNLPHFCDKHLLRSTGRGVEWTSDTHLRWTLLPRFHGTSINLSPQGTTGGQTSSARLTPPSSNTTQRLRWVEGGSMFCTSPTVPTSKSRSAGKVTGPIQPLAYSTVGRSTSLYPHSRNESQSASRNNRDCADNMWGVDTAAKPKALLLNVTGIKVLHDKVV